MFGTMSTRALGVSPTQRAIETGWVFFAPRYTRASLAYCGNIFKGGIVGHEARRTLGQLAAGGMITYIATCKALGQEPHLDPRYPTFMTIKIGNRQIGVGGFYYGFLRFITDVGCSVVEEGGNKRTDFLSLSRRDNPFIKFWYNRASPLAGLTVGIREQRDFLGYPLETPQDWAQWLIVEHMLPIALQSQFPAGYEERPTQPIPLLIAEEAGLRTFPAEPFYELSDKYAQQVYGVNWKDLYDEKVKGLTTRQKYLINRFPDLKAAWEPYHAKHSKIWQAEHGLLD